MAKLAIDVVLNKAAAMTGLRGMEKDFLSFGKSMLGVMGIGGGLAGLVAGIDNVLAKAGQLQDVSDAFNISAESIQRLAAVGVTANLSIEEIGSKLGKLGKAAQEAASGNVGLASAFAKIGVAGQDLASLNPEQLFNKLRQAVSSGALAGEELKIVNELLAKDFQRFLPILRMTTEEFERLGGSSIVMSDEMVSSLDTANVTLRTFQNQASQAFSYVVGAALDAAAVIKENPLMIFQTMDPNFEKALKDRQEKLKKAIADERKMRAGIEKNVVDEKKIEDENKAFEKSEQAAARHDLKLIDAQLLGKEEAEKQKAAIEERYAQRSLDRARELAQQRADLMPDLEDLRAERAGPAAERALLQRRATEAGEQARKSKNVEDVARAERAALAFQRAKESQLRARGFGDESTSMARSAANQAVGPLPSSAELQQSLDDSKESINTLTDKQAENTKQLEKLNIVLDKMHQENNRNPKNFPTAFENQMADEEASLLPGNFSPGIGEMFDFKKLLGNIPDLMSAPKTQPVELENPPDLKPIMEKLDQLIKNAGVFS
jgi:hypothetical protein